MYYSLALYINFLNLFFILNVIYTLLQWFLVSYFMQILFCSSLILGKIFFHMIDRLIITFLLIITYRFWLKINRRVMDFLFSLRVERILLKDSLKTRKCKLTSESDCAWVKKERLELCNLFTNEFHC